MTAVARGSSALGRWLVAAMACALIAHAAVYHSFVPGDGMHGYFAWYVPVVAAASACSLLAILVGGLCAGSRPARLIGALLPARSTRYRGGSVAGLASGGLAFLILQESLERSFNGGGLTLATFHASAWPVLMAVLFLTAAAILAVGRTAVVLSERALADRADRPRSTRLPQRRGSGPIVVRKNALLGWHAGLRAPPLVA